MTVVSGYRGRLAPLLLSVLGLLVAQVASAKSGGVDYSWGAGALAKAHDYTVTMMLYVLYVCYAVGSVMAIISALLIYFKMQYHEGEVVKNIMTLIQDAVPRGRGHEEHHDAHRCGPVHHRRLDRLPGLLRLQDIREIHPLGIAKTGAHVGTDAGRWEGSPLGAITRSQTTKRNTSLCERFSTV